MMAPQKRKALGTSGNRGIGVAVTQELLGKGYDTFYVLARMPTDTPISDSVRYYKTDLVKDDLRV